MKFLECLCKIFPVIRLVTETQSLKTVIDSEFFDKKASSASIDSYLTKIPGEGQANCGRRCTSYLYCNRWAYDEKEDSCFIEVR